MDRGLTTWGRFAAGLVVAIMLALPSVVQAHPGHYHAGPTSSQATQADAALRKEARLEKKRSEARKPVAQELREHRASGADASDPAASAGHACCAICASSACVSLLMPFVPSVAPPSGSYLMAARDGPHRCGVLLPSPQRPPETFA